MHGGSAATGDAQLRWCINGAAKKELDGFGILNYNP